MGLSGIPIWAQNIPYHIPAQRELRDYELAYNGPDFPFMRPISSLATAQGAANQGADSTQQVNQQIDTSGFSLSSLGGIFGTDNSQQNGFGDLYNFLLALNSGKTGAQGTNLFSGIEV